MAERTGTGRRGTARTAAALLVLGALSGCSGLIPPEGPSLMDGRPVIAAGPSAQRLGPDGYPLLGAFPNTATTQLDSATVESESQGLVASGSRQNAQVRSASAEYQASVAEARKIRAQHERDVTAITAVEIQKNAARKSNEDVLRAIEGR